MKLQTKNLFQPLTDHLEAMIASGHYPTGTRLPSLRRLCDEFNLSRGTAARGLDYLRDKGLIELRQGSGAYVSERNRRSAGRNGRRIAVFSEHSDTSESYCAHIIVGIQRRAGSTGTTLNLHLYRYGEIDSSILEDAAREADALLLLGSYDSFIDDLPHIRPVVGFDMQKSYGFASVVGLDPSHAALLGCDYFRRHGFSRVKVIGFPMPSFRFRAEVFAFHWRETGGQVETFLPFEPFSADFYSDKTIYDRTIEQLEDPDCGYLFVSGTVCCRTQQSYREKFGRDLADDRCLLSIDGKSLLVPGYPGVSTVTPDYAEIGATALDECLRRIENPGARPRRILVSGTLVER